MQSWALAVFFYNLFPVTYFWASPLQNPTPSEINLIENAKNISFRYYKIKNIPQVPSSDHMLMLVLIINKVKFLFEFDWHWNNWLQLLLALNFVSSP